MSDSLNDPLSNPAEYNQLNPFNSTNVNTDAASSDQEESDKKELCIEYKPKSTSTEDVDDRSKALPVSLIPEGQFPFYGCAICNISYMELKELDNHIISHKNRITSWDLRVKAVKAKRKLKKAKKRKLHLTDEASEIEAMKKEEDTEGDKSLEKIFKCAGCFKQFSLSYYLKLHVRSHTGEKPYQCAECGVAFITASKLGRHKRMHTSSKFECRICHKLFSRFDTLTKHFDKKHMDAKLEGEPYDFNEILPYLKDLEEGVEHKNVTPDAVVHCNADMLNEAPVTAKEDVKPTDIKMELVDVKEEKVEVLKMDNGVENVQTVQVTVTDIKKESDDHTTDNEDYFPSDTWAAPDFDLSDDAEEPLIVTKNKMYREANKKLEAHTPALKAEDDSDPLKCKVCSKQIKTPTYLRIHMRTHTGERPFKCYVCQKGFITSSKMNRHILTHMDDTWDDEKKVSAEKNNLKQESEWDQGNNSENETKNNAPAKKKRKTRKRNVVSKSYIEDIIKQMPDQEKKRVKRPHACDFCNKRFLHLDTLRIHKQSHKGEERIISCEFCLTEYPTAEALTEHLVSHGGTHPYLCTLCGKVYKRRETMVYHRKMHDAYKKYQCDLCSKTFTAPCKLQRHLVSHRPNKFVIRYECPVCAHIFNTKYHIEMHLTTHEKDGLIQKENRGEIMAMVLQNARRIPLEVDSPHSNPNLIPKDERSRICNICGEIFHHFYYLEEHLKTHGTIFNMESLNDAKRIKLEEAERRYKCEVCNKGFKLHYYLKLHSFTHTKEKPFMCQQCGKGFITKGKLKRHMESHTGLKKYQCHICCKYFTRPSYLRIHVKTIHGKTKDGYSIPMPLSSSYMGPDSL